MTPVTDPALLEILNGSAPAGPTTGPVYGPGPKAPAAPTSLQINADRRAEEAAALNRQRFEYQQQKDAAKSGGESGKSTDIKMQAKMANLEALTGQINRVQELYDNNFKDEAVPILSSLMEYLPTPTNRQFDSAAAGMAEQGMGAFRVPGVGAQSDTELRQFVEANRPAASDSDLAIEEKLRQLRARVDATREQMGLDPAQWNAGAAIPDGAYGSANPKAPALTAAPTEFAPSNDTRSVVDEETSALIDRMVRAGAPIGAINSMLGQRQFDPIDQGAYDEWRAFLADNPNYGGSTAEAMRSEQLSGMDAAGNALGGALGEGASAFLTGAGQFLSGNTLDNLSSDPAAARFGMGQSQERNPGATFAGEMTGGVLAALTGEAGLARLGMASGIGRGVAADAAMGSANGAGMADGGDRLSGAMQGGLAATAGSLGGSMLMKGAAGALAPTGGSLAELYAAGVRPTPGQRFANSGVAGRALNATEEALQSIPIVGAAIGGARQEARDQFQVGAFNQALADIGEALPAGMKPGTDPQKFTQEAFNRVYDKARSGMTLVVDEALANDLSGLAPDIATLGPQAQNKLKAIMRNSVNNKLTDGQMAGEAYKTAVSDLGKHIGRLRKSAMGEDQALADILDGVKGALDGSARRNSDPAAVELLDAADAGYSKFVRIEDAARRRGGDDGTFSPSQFSAAVQNTDSSVRSKRFLRGEAAMQDYANQGGSLTDRMSNSATTDRALTAGAVATAGAAYMEPTTLGILGAIGAAYAPGVRKGVKGALAPAGPRRKAIASQLEKRARLAGRVGAGSAAVALPGTTPGQ